MQQNATTYQNSSENYATFNRSIHYNLVLVRSPGFGSNRSTVAQKTAPIFAYYVKTHVLLNADII